MSHLARGVWVEIGVFIVCNLSIRSHLARGVWVEILMLPPIVNMYTVTPRERCVSRNSLASRHSSTVPVTPRERCVSRNYRRFSLGSPATASHLARGVWVEIKMFYSLPFGIRVTPRERCVSRKRNVEYAVSIFIVTPRERCVSRNIVWKFLLKRRWVTPRERCVSRNWWF